MIRAIAVFLIMGASVAFASNFPRVDRDIAVYDNHVIQLRGRFTSRPANPFSKVWVISKLAHMAEVDQYSRSFLNTPSAQFYSEAETSEFFTQFGPRLLQVDTGNTFDLKYLLKIHSWFTIRKFGIQADRNAWLLVQHADQDLLFQRSIVKILEALYPKGETNPVHFAYLFDRVAAAWNAPSQRKLQRFGTQGMCVGQGKWVPLPTEDPARLDDRRQDVGLGPYSDYLSKMQNFCN